MRTRKVSYIERESEDGSFTPHIYDKKLVKKIEAICMIKGINRTHYVVNAIKSVVEKDLLELQEREKNVL